MQSYHLVLVPDDGEYMVLVPALPGCVTSGTSIDDAVAMAKEAISLHIEGMIADGEDVPEEEGEPVVTSVCVDVDIATLRRKSKRSARS